MTDKELEWHKYFIEMAKLVATKSEDRSTKVGIVLVGEDNEVIGIGYNGFPRGVLNKEERHERPVKYKYTEHAERNAIYNCARQGIKTKGATAYFNWEPIPCSDCCRALIQAGVKRFVGPNIPFGGKMDWSEHLQISKEMINEANIEVIYIND